MLVFIAYILSLDHPFKKKPLIEINLIEINLQINCQNLEASLFYNTEYKNVKNCL